MSHQDEGLHSRAVHLQLTVSERHRVAAEIRLHGAWRVGLVHLDGPRLSGQTTGPRGQSRDSDPTVSRSFRANSLIHKRALGSESRL